MEKTIMDVVKDILEDNGICESHSKEFEYEVQQLVNAIETYIDDYDTFQTDPYTYNGVSRADFF